MAHMYNRVVSVITKRYDERTDEDILPLLPWFSKKSKLFESMKQDVLLDILRHCDFTVRPTDDVIIRQGDRGDCFYIILSGKVSIFINTEGVPEAADAQNGADTKADEKLDRTKFGRFIAPIDAGKAFGELALINKDCVRNASIIADEKTDLLVIDRELYNRSLKAAQEAELKQRQDFVNMCPLFENWQQKYKKQVGMSLHREQLPFDATIVKQGAPVDGLHFIVKGQAKIIVDASMHEQQYPSIMLETDPDEADRHAAIEEIIGTAAKRASSRTVGTEEVNEEQSMKARGQRSSRRPVSVSQKVKRALEVSLIGANEIIGDIEQAIGVQTYMHTVKCTQPTEVFILDAKNYERLVTGKNQDTITMLQELARIRLRSKMLRSLDSSIPIIRCFMFRLRALRKMNAGAPDIASDHVTKQHTKGLLTYENFIPQRGPVIDFYGPGTVFYRNKQRRSKHSGRLHHGDHLLFDEESSDARLEFPPTRSGAASSNSNYLMTNRSIDFAAEPKSTTSSRFSDYETSNEHLQKLEQRIREWFSSIKHEKVAKVAGEDTLISGRNEEPSLEALKLRRFEPQTLAVVKPGAKVRLHRRYPREVDSDEDSDYDAASERTFLSRQTTIVQVPKASNPISNGAAAQQKDKKLTLNDYAALRLLLKQKEREFVNRRAPVI